MSNGHSFLSRSTANSKETVQWEDGNEYPLINRLTLHAHKLRFTNLDKVFWPDLGITKGDLIEYYRAAAPAMLLFLRDRPLVLDETIDCLATLLRLPGRKSDALDA